jgi:anti-sigma B factor antagonist
MIADKAQFEQVNNLVILRPGVEQLTGPDMQELTATMSERVRYDNAQLFVIDMTGVKFIDSATIGAIVTFLQDLEHVRGRLAMANCQPNVAFLFKVTRLDAVVGLFDDVEEARTALE